MSWFGSFGSGSHRCSRDIRKSSIWIRIVTVGELVSFGVIVQDRWNKTHVMNRRQVVARDIDKPFFIFEVSF